MNNKKLINLTEYECLSINAGESAWYWIAYGVRRFSDWSSDNVHVGSWADK